MEKKSVPELNPLRNLLGMLELPCDLVVDFFDSGLCKFVWDLDGIWMDGKAALQS